MKPTSMAFERRYSDNSGVEFAVRYVNCGIEFEHINTAEFPIEELDWLIACLQRIKDDAKEQP